MRNSSNSEGRPAVSKAAGGQTEVNDPSLRAAVAGMTAVEVAVLALLGLVGGFGVLLLLAGFITGDNVVYDFTILPPASGLAFAGFSSMLMVLLRNRLRSASAWLASGVGLWLAGITLVGCGGFALMVPGQESLLQDLAIATMFCFGPGGLMAAAGLGAYFYDRRRRDTPNSLAAAPSLAASQSRTARVDAKMLEIRQKLSRAAEYRQHIEQLIKQKQDGPYHHQLAPIKENLSRWEKYMSQLVQRIQDFESNEIIQRDLREVPESIARLEGQLAAEENPQVRREIEETLRSYQTHARQLEDLRALVRRIELDLDETLAKMGSIYSQLQILDTKDVDSSRARRLSADINEQALRLNDLLDAVDDVYSDSAGAN